ncbi:MAG: hypothetical protein WBL20_07830 [Sphingobium sp.]|uniref:hypothetical protein n=1 Tax=Sphingobium sp. TaxID=1912891 RepID=UPI003BAF3819
MGEAGASVPAPVSPKPCLCCDRPTTDQAAVLVDEQGRPITFIAICPDCIGIADQFGLGSTIQTGEA